MSRNHSTQDANISKRITHQSQSSYSQLGSSDQLELSRPIHLTDPRPHVSTRLKPGQTGRLVGRKTTKFEVEPIPVSKSAKGLAYDKVKKIEAIEREKSATTNFDDIMKEVKNILKDDVNILFESIIPGEAKSDVGKAILADGCFFVAFSKILMKSPFMIKKLHLETLRRKFTENITENKPVFQKYLNQEDEKLKKEEEKRKQAWEAREEQRLAKVSSSRKSKKNIHEDSKEQSESQKKPMERKNIYVTPILPIMEGSYEEQGEVFQRFTQQQSPSTIPITFQNPPMKRKINKVTPFFTVSQGSYIGEVEASKKPLQQQSAATLSKTFQDSAINTSGAKLNKNGQKSILKPSRLSPESLRRTIRWSDINFEDSQYMNEVVVANKAQIYQQNKAKMEKQKKERRAVIKKQQSFLLDFFEINDVYESDDIELVGMIDQIDEKYAIMIVKPKIITPQSSFMKTRNSHQMAKERQIAQKQRKDFIAIGLMKKISTYDHDLDKLKEIERNYKDVYAFIDIKDPESFFLGSLPEDSVDGGSEKKEKKDL